MSDQIESKLIMQLAQFLALADHRCHDEAGHARIIHGEACVTCHRDIFGYLAVIPKQWPA
jgi:hypothetical protein